MKKVNYLLALLLLTAIFSSCEKITGEGPVLQQTRTVTDFSKVDVSISGTVNYTIDPVYKVEVIAQQNILEVLRTERVGDELVIKFKNGVRVKSHEQIIVNVSSPTLRSVNLGGSAEFTISGPLAGNDLDLRISGSGSINIQQLSIADKLTATISGSGNITALAGTAKSENLKISGSGSIHLHAVQADKATADISGSGDIKVKASQTLTANISGSGSVYYLGNPVISSHVSGSGKVLPL